MFLRPTTIENVLDSLPTKSKLSIYNNTSRSAVSEFNEFKPRLKSHKNRFQLSAGLNVEKLNTILSKTSKFERRLKFRPRLKFFKFGLWTFKKNIFPNLFTNGTPRVFIGSLNIISAVWPAIARLAGYSWHINIYIWAKSLL